MIDNGCDHNKNVVPDNMGIVTYQIRAIPFGSVNGCSCNRSLGIDHTGKKQDHCISQVLPDTDQYNGGEGPSERSDTKTRRIFHSYFTKQI